MVFTIQQALKYTETIVYQLLINRLLMIENDIIILPYKWLCLTKMWV